jgi:tetratricopeptide (TPR) repeat protein
MPLKWDCLEAVAGIGLGAAACFAAANPMAAAAVVPAVAGAKLFSLFGAAREKHGLESEKELARIRSKVLADWAHADPHGQFDVESADAALARLLEGAMPDAMTLGRLVATPDYPGEVVTLVLAQLARRDDRFGRDGHERHFASIVIRAALEEALANQDYTKALTVPMLVGLGAGMAAANEKLDLLVARAEAGFDADEVRALQQFQAAVLQLAQLANDRADKPEAALAELRAMLRTVLDQRTRSEQGSNLGPWLDQMIKQVVYENNAGRFSAGAQIIASAWEERLRQRAERAEAERAADLQMCDFAIGQQRLVPGGATNAANWLQRKLAIETETNLAPLAALARVYTEWMERGRDFGTDFDLEVAIALCHAVLADLTSADKVADREFGRWQSMLGQSLRILGRRQDDPATLNAAIVAYRAALSIRTRDALPFDWAKTQNGFGIALAALGERQDDPTALQAAIAAYRAALTVRTREAFPRAWAITLNNLGNALRNLGERQGDAAMLEEAIAVLRDALFVRTRDTLPLAWAMTQNNLGNALHDLGELEDDLAALCQATLAFQDALEVRTRKRLPLDWAATMNNLGNTRRALGERQRNPAAITDAISVFHDTLAIRTREALPLAWAMTQNNIGTALRAIGEIQEARDKVRDAISAFESALLVYKAPGLDFYRHRTERNLVRARELLEIIGT